MKTKAVEMPDGYEFSHVGDNGEIIVKKIKSKYPLSVKEVGDRDWCIASNGEVDDFPFSRNINQLSTKERAEAFLALMQLVELRDAWNKVDGFVVDWNDFEQDKWCITPSSGNVEFNIYGNMSRVLFFNTLEKAKLFAETFKYLILTAKELL